MEISQFFIHGLAYSFIYFTGHQFGAPLPLTASVREIMQALKVDGLSDSDHGGLVRYFEKQAKIELKRCAAP